VVEQYLLNVLVLSAIYIIVTLGFALTFSIAGILNLAHGVIYMLGGYGLYYLWVGLGLNPGVALLLVVLVTGSIGFGLEQVGFRRCLNSFERIILFGLAVIFIVETGINVTMGATAKAIPPLLPGVVHIGAASVDATRLGVLLISGLLLAATIVFVRNTKLGQEMLAVSEDREGAILQGIHVNRVSGLACAIGGCLAGIAGALMGSVMSLDPFMGDGMLMKAFEIITIAGIGGLEGILPAGLLLGGIDSILPTFVGGAVSSAIGFCFVFVLLLVRPQGLFGHKA
jgi:branched-subunit amino acid ABC-type transport system permease component